METVSVGGRPIAIDLFAGCGGFSLGLEQAGFDIAAAVDIDPVHALTFAYNHPASRVLCRDIRGLSGSELIAAAREDSRAGGYFGEIDCIAGGPSCQGFSAIGLRDPADARNDLLSEFARLVAEVRPRYFVMENVPGLLNPAHAHTFRDVLALLTSAGYDLGTSPWTLDASEHGTPQRRLRVFLVGAREGLPIPIEPRAVPMISAGDAIGDLLALDSFPRASTTTILSDAEVLALEAASSDYARSMRAPERSRDLAAPRAWNPRLLTGVGATAHNPEVVARFDSLAPGRRDSVSRMPRLDAQAPSPTLRAGTTPDHGSFTSVRPIHYALPRVITVREAARLHSFPDWYRFHDTRWLALRQIGNAVPPALGRAVGAAIVRALAIEPPVPAELTFGDSAILGLSLSEAADRLGVDRSTLPRRVAA